MYQPPLSYGVCDCGIAIGDAVAFAHSLNRISGTLKTGEGRSFWLRWTACFQKIDGAWLIVHDHVSVPVDAGAGKTLMNLER